MCFVFFFFFFSSRRRHTRWNCDWSSDVCSSDLYSAGALYQAYTAPGEITDIALQDGEQLVGTGPVAAGDTVRWIIGDTESGDRKSTRLNSSHSSISYAVFCLKKKKTKDTC